LRRRRVDSFIIRDVREVLVVGFAVVFVMELLFKCGAPNHAFALAFFLLSCQGKQGQ
jgi:hypothetical protein